MAQQIAQSIKDLTSYTPLVIFFYPGYTIMNETKRR